jgi:hypothetical protein
MTPRAAGEVLHLPAIAPSSKRCLRTNPSQLRDRPRQARDEKGVNHHTRRDGCGSRVRQVFDHPHRTVWTLPEENRVSGDRNVAFRLSRRPKNPTNQGIQKSRRRLDANIKVTFLIQLWTRLSVSELGMLHSRSKTLSYVTFLAAKVT